MVIKKDTLYKSIIGVLLLIPTLIKTIEVNIVLLSLIMLWVFYNYSFKYSRALVNLILPLTVILLISIFSSFFHSSTLFDFIKDFFFIAKPIFYILIGYYMFSNIKDKEVLFKLIIYLGFFFAIIHIWKAIYFIYNNDGFNINQLRNYAGRGNVIEVFALVVLFSKNGKSLFQFNSKYKRVIRGVLVVSFICYMSRNITVSTIILFMGINGYLATTKKGLLYMFGFFLFITLFYTYLFSIDLKRGATGLEGFLYKVKIAPAEIFDSEINIEDHSDLWDHWRAYEAQKAFEQIYNTPMFSGLFIGKGTGSLVDLEFVAPLNEEGMQYITVLHNGYSYITFKAGIIGLIMFLLFLLILYMQAYIKSSHDKIIIINYFLSSIAIYYMFTTLIVSGAYNPRDFVGIIIGGLLAIINYHYKINKTLDA